MATFNSQVAASADDAGYTSFFLQNNVAIVYLGNQSGTPNNVIARFNNVTIPQGATISNAVIQLDVIGFSTGTLSLISKCAAADNATMPANASAAVSAAKTTGTTASVAWSSSSGFQSLDITAEVQAVVNRAGWASGNSIVVYVLDNGTTSGRYATTGQYDDLASEAPKLSVTYSSGGSTKFSHSFWSSFGRPLQHREGF